MHPRNAETGESAHKRPPRAEGAASAATATKGQGRLVDSATFRNLSADKKKEVRTQERNQKKQMKRSMSYFQHVGEALAEAGAAATTNGASASSHAQRVDIVEGFSTELIKKLRADFSLLYRSSTICRTVEKALAAGATRAHVDALLYVFLGHMKDLLSVPKTSYLVETLFAAVFHTVGLECDERGGGGAGAAHHLDDVIDTPSAASTPPLRRLLQSFAEEICDALGFELSFNSAASASSSASSSSTSFVLTAVKKAKKQNNKQQQQQQHGAAMAAVAEAPPEDPLAWLNQRSAARGLASILRCLSGIPVRGAPPRAPGSGRIAFDFAVLPISKALRKAFRNENDFLNACCDASMTFLVQAFLMSACANVHDTWARDLFIAGSNNNNNKDEQDDENDEEEDAVAAVVKPNEFVLSSLMQDANGTRVLECAIEANPGSAVTHAVLQLIKAKTAKKASASSSKKKTSNKNNNDEDDEEEEQEESADQRASPSAPHVSLFLLSTLISALMNLNNNSNNNNSGGAAKSHWRGARCYFDEEVCDLWKSAVKPQLVSVFLKQQQQQQQRFGQHDESAAAAAAAAPSNANNELAALAKIIRSIGSIHILQRQQDEQKKQQQQQKQQKQAATTTAGNNNSSDSQSASMSVKELRTDLVHDIMDALKQSSGSGAQKNNNNNKNNNAAPASVSKKNPLLIICGWYSARSGGNNSASAASSPAMATNSGGGGNLAGPLEFLEAVLGLGQQSSSMLVHTWDKIAIDELLAVATTSNVGSRALQLLVPHIAATRVQSTDENQIRDALRESGGGGKSATAKATTTTITLQPNLQKFIRRLTNSEVCAAVESTAAAAKPKQAPQQQQQQLLQQQQQQYGAWASRANPRWGNQHPNHAPAASAAVEDAAAETNKKKPYPTLKALICNNFSAFLVQKVFDESVLWLKAALIRRIAELCEDDDEVKQCFVAKKLAIHCRVDQFLHRQDEWFAEAEKAAGVKKLLSTILAKIDA